MYAIIAITLLSIASYATGLKAVFAGKYKPNVYSRVIWLLIAVNALVGVVKVGSNTDVIMLSAIQTIGSLLLMLASFKYSIFEFGIVELISSCLLLLSLLVWIQGSLPAVNIAISLIAHFIGGLPTIKTVIKKPKSENTLFWSYFALASLVALITMDRTSFSVYMFPLYFLLFNSSISLLSLRKVSR